MINDQSWCGICKQAVIYLHPGAMERHYYWCGVVLGLHYVHQAGYVLTCIRLFVDWLLLVWIQIKGTDLGMFSHFHQHFIGARRTDFVGLTKNVGRASSFKTVCDQSFTWMHAQKHVILKETCEHFPATCHRKLDLLKSMSLGSQTMMQLFWA